MYGNLYGMHKTTIYLPDDLKVGVERLATDEKKSEAEVIRAAIRQAIGARVRPRPRVPLTSRGLGDPTASERVDALLSGFGRR